MSEAATSERPSAFIAGTPTAWVKLDTWRELAFTLGALQRVKDKLGTLDVSLSGPDAAALLPVYVWACLSKDGRRALTPEDVADMLHPGNMEEVASAVRALHERSRPDETANPTPAAEGTPPGDSSR